MIRRVVVFVGASAMLAVATWMIAWWMVPVVVALWAFGDQADRWVPIKSAVAGALSWGLLLLIDSAGSGVGRIAGAVGGVIGIGALPLGLLTLLFPALLAASAAGVVRAVSGAGGRGLHD